MIYLIGIGCVALALSHYGFYRWGKAVAERKHAEAQIHQTEVDHEIDSEPPISDPLSGLHS